MTESLGAACEIVEMEQRLRVGGMNTGRHQKKGLVVDFQCRGVGDTDKGEILLRGNQTLSTAPVQCRDGGGLR